MKHKLISCIAAALLTGAYLGEVSRAPKYVPTGSIVYAQGKPLTSREFYWCSAIILDENDKAIYAHATPGGMASEANVCVGDVVEKLLEKAKKNNIDLNQSFAIINAGSETFLTRIEDDFKKQGIPVYYASTKYIQEAENRLPRTVSYDPRDNHLEIRRGVECMSTNLVGARP